MADILVTGATGLLGSQLVRRLVESEVGTTVRILRRSTSSLALLGSAADQVEHHVGDITDPFAVRDALHGAKRVYHAAALIRFGGAADRKAMREVNVEGTANVVNGALREEVERIVHVSSMAALGRPAHGDGLINESHPWAEDDRSQYAISKYDSELEIQRGIAEGLDATIINPSLIFGIGRPGENTRRIVDRIRRERVPAFPPGGTNVVDVRDVVDGAIRAMHLGETGERYFLGSENLSFEEIFSTLADAFGVRAPRMRAPSSLVRAAAGVAEGLAMVTGTQPLLSGEQARSATSFNRYSNRKARTKLSCTFRPFSETARWLAAELA